MKQIAVDSMLSTHENNTRNWINNASKKVRRFSRKVGLDLSALLLPMKEESDVKGKIETALPYIANIAKISKERSNYGDKQLYYVMLSNSCQEYIRASNEWLNRYH